MRPTIEWRDETVVMIDQRKLPAAEVYVECRTAKDVAKAIKTMVIRGAPAIGVAAAMGLALGVRRSKATGTQELAEEFYRLCDVLAATRPTAVNLFWAIERMKGTFSEAARAGQSPAKLCATMRAESEKVHDEDVASCKAVGRFGAEVVRDGSHVLTHCNAGALATGGYGTALGVIRAAVDNGDVANKIGTYTVAVLAKTHEVPFYVAAPVSTVDLSTMDGSGIPIEERPAREVTHIGSKRVAPEGVRVWNPALDVTPHDLIAGIITDHGLCRPPYIESLKAACDRGRRGSTT